MGNGMQGHMASGFVTDDLQITRKTRRNDGCGDAIRSLVPASKTSLEARKTNTEGLQLV